MPIIGSLFGAALARSQAKRDAETQRAQSLDDVENQFVRLRAGAEKAGYNPLAVLGMASGIPASGGAGSSAAFMGQAIADSSMMLAENMARTQAGGNLARVTALEGQNAQLQHRLTNLTLRPNVPGVYETRARATQAAANSAAPPLRGPAGATGDQYAAADFPNREHRLADDLGVVSLPSPTLDRAPGGYLFGLRWAAIPGWTSPAEMESSNWGDNELLSYPYGAAWASGTAGYNAKRAENAGKARWFGLGPTMQIGGKPFVMERYTPRRMNPAWNNADPALPHNWGKQ